MRVNACFGTHEIHRRITRSALLPTLALAAALGFAPGSSLANVINEWASAKIPPAPELKPVTLNPQTTALLMLDFLPANCGVRPRCMASLEPMRKLLSDARGQGLTVIHSVFGNFTASDILPQVAPAPGEAWVKSFADKFMDTNLEKMLKDKSIETVIVAGTAANGAVLYTGSGAGLRGFKVVVPVDGISSADLYAEQFSAWQLINGPTFGARVTLTRSDLIKF